MKLRHKFRAKPSTEDDIKFSSKKERNRYLTLKLLQQQEKVLFFLRQVPFHLPGNVKYLCDFLVFWADGNVTIEDVKGVRTPLYITKKKIVESTYKVHIEEI